MTLDKTIQNYKELLDKYNIKYEEGSGKNIMINCPFHNDSKPSLSINKYTGLNNCFSTKCKYKGGNYNDFKLALEKTQMNK